MSLWENCFAGEDNQMHMNKYVPYPVEFPEQLNRFLGTQQGYKAWLIRRKKEQDIIGFAIHGNFIPKMPNSIGFNIGLNYTKNGYAKESLCTLVNYVREQGLTETFGLCFENNIASIKTMESCGFTNMGETGEQFNGIQELVFRILL